MIARLLIAALLGLVASAPARAQDGAARPVVVELFTSQGCTSCPRANRLLGAIADEPDVVALTFGVGYWDYLGWTDTFARPEYSNRQRNYARALRLRAPYTPQFVIGGVRQLTVSQLENLEAVTEEVRAQGPPQGAPGVAIARTDEGWRFEVGEADERDPPADVWLVEFEPGPLTVQILGGDLAGRRVIHHNVVRDVTRLGAWSGAAVSFERGRCRPRCALIVQAPEGGPILAATMARR